MISRTATALPWVLALAASVVGVGHAADAPLNTGAGTGAEARKFVISPSARQRSVVSVAPALPLTLAFEELWEPRTLATGVTGVVTPQELKQTPDGADPQQPWERNRILARWGTLRLLDGSVPGLPNVTGLGPNPWWMVRDGRLFFHAGPARAPTGESTGGFALISRQTFPRSQRIVIEADLAVTEGSDSAFAGLALIAGEGDYRELALYRRGKVDSVDRVTPLRATQLALRTTDVTRLRLEYDPKGGFRYFINGRLAGTEPLGHAGADFAADPHVGLYFTGNSSVPNAFVGGFVGPLRVWVDGVNPG